MMPFSFPNHRFNHPQTPYIPSESFYNRANNFKFNEHYNTASEKSINNYIETKKEQESNSCSSDNLFDFLGMNLASDDLIIIALLFFLYNEKVNDTYLFIALIMLLLS